jgi:hypothetical protein
MDFPISFRPKLVDALEDLFEKLQKGKKELILCAPDSQPLFGADAAGIH